MAKQTKQTKSPKTPKTPKIHPICKILTNKIWTLSHDMPEADLQQLKRWDKAGATFLFITVWSDATHLYSSEISSLTKELDDAARCAGIQERKAFVTVLPKSNAKKYEGWLLFQSREDCSNQARKLLEGQMLI